jgi:hypothetical protein
MLLSAMLRRVSALNRGRLPPSQAPFASEARGPLRFD